MRSALIYRWKRSSVDAMLLAVIICVLIACGTVGFQSIQWIRKNSDLVSQTRESIASINQLESALIDAETGQRGYIITGNEEYLGTFNNTANRIKTLTQKLQKHPSIKDQQLHEPESIQSLIEQKMNELQTTITLRGEGMSEAAENLVKNDTGKQIMDEIREQLALMKT